MLQAPESGAQTREDYLPFLRDHILVELDDGSRIYGELVDVREDELRIYSDNRTLSVPFSSIRTHSEKSEYLDSLRNSLYRNPHFGDFMPTGFGSKGFQFRTDLGVLNRLTYGFNENFSISIGGGIPIDGNFPIAVMPKYSIPLRNGHLSTALLFGNVFDKRRDTYIFGVWVNSLTLGDKYDFITLSLGPTFSTGDGTYLLCTLEGRFNLYRALGMNLGSYFTDSPEWHFINTGFLLLRFSKFELGLGVLYNLDSGGRRLKHSFLPLAKFIYRQ